MNRSSTIRGRGFSVQWRSLLFGVPALLIAVVTLAHGAEPARIDALVQAHLAETGAPGMSVGIVKNGEVLVAKGYGLANVEHGVPVTEKTIFQSASIAKQFTATAIMLLVEDGKLELDAPLSRYLPDTPASWKDVTIRRMLTHTSGIPDYTKGTLDLRVDYTDDELVKRMLALPLHSEPGTAWSYSNSTYAVLGILIHRVSGQFYGDLLQERVFSKIGMKTARVISEADIVPNRAAGYRNVNGALKNQEWASPTINTLADGGLYLTVLDLIAWDRAIKAGAVLRPESWKEIFTPATLKSGATCGYGFGWYLDQPGGERRQSHGGSWQGFRSAIVRYPDRDLTVVVLANYTAVKPMPFALAVARAIAPDLPEAALAPAEKPGPAPTPAKPAQP